MEFCGKKKGLRAGEQTVVIAFSKEEIEKIRESCKMRNMDVEDYVRVHALLNADYYTSVNFNQ